MSPPASRLAEFSFLVPLHRSLPIPFRLHRRSTIMNPAGDAWVNLQPLALQKGGAAPPRGFGTAFPSSGGAGSKPAARQQNDGGIYRRAPVALLEEFSVEICHNPAATPATFKPGANPAKPRGNNEIPRLGPSVVDSPPA